MLLFIKFKDVEVFNYVDITIIQQIIQFKKTSERFRGLLIKFIKFRLDLPWTLSLRFFLHQFQNHLANLYKKH